MHLRAHLRARARPRQKAAVGRGSRPSKSGWLLLRLPGSSSFVPGSVLPATLPPSGATSLQPAEGEDESVDVARARPEHRPGCECLLDRRLSAGAKRRGTFARGGEENSRTPARGLASGCRPPPYAPPPPRPATTR